MASHPILGLIYIIKSLHKQGLDVSPLLQRYGLNLEHLAPDARIDRNLELRLLCELAEELEEPSIGLSMGNGVGFAGYGSLGLLMLSCDTVFEVMHCGLRYQQLTYLFSELGFHPGEKTSALTLTPLKLAEPARRLMIDLQMAGTYKFIRDIQTSLHKDLYVIQVDIPYPKPAQAQLYEQFYGCPVNFAATKGRFWMHNEHLQWHLPSGDPTAKALYRQQCDQLLQQQKQEQASSNLAEQVCAHLALFTEGFPTAAEVAAILGFPERTLRHELRSLGTSFRRILDELRFNRARQLLENSQLSVETIAGKLGYAESAAFIHAFQRWSGCSPAVYRRQQHKAPEN
ncbi:AraC family transcriptional regulator ligand-binding domain-containing protein [Pseudomonas sp. LjRoot71]|uniref:AraC family transcriptional regulator n=1 Tax=unclassified Pseudomonas TaxID=196821 RepID=UPI0025E772CA|nr:AraC family transcriptional regulator [Pseudomonas sp. UBA7530]